MNDQPTPSGERLRRSQLLLIGVLAFAFFYSFAGQKDFWRKPDGRIAVVAREMIESRDYLVPTLAGQPRFEKPPMMYWAVAGASVLFNHGEVTPWTAAFPSALAGALACMMTALVTARLFDRKTGLRAALILATSYGSYWWGHIGEMEMLYTAAICLAVGAFILWDLHPRRTAWLFSAYGFAALAVLTKGPFALLIILIGGLVYGLLRKRAGQPTAHYPTRWHALGFALFLILVLPWPALVLAEAKETFVAEIFGRLSSDYDRHAAGPFYYVLYFPRLAFPWIIALPLILWRFRRDWGTLAKQHGPALFLAIWFLMVLVMFSLVRTKQVHYLLPMLPAYAMLTAWAVTGIRRAELAVTGLALVAAIGWLIYGGYRIPIENAQRSPRLLAEEVLRKTGSGANGLSFYYLYSLSATADLRADLLFYLGSRTRVIAINHPDQPKSATEFQKHLGSARYVVVSVRHWNPAWAQELTGWRVLSEINLEKDEAGKAGKDKFYLLARTGS